MALTMPNWPLSDQRQTMPLIVSDTAQGSMMMTRAMLRPIEVLVEDERDRDREKHRAADDEDGPDQRADQAGEEERVREEPSEIGRRR